MSSTDETNTDETNTGADASSQLLEVAEELIKIGKLDETAADATASSQLLEQAEELIKMGKFDETAASYCTVPNRTQESQDSITTIKDGYVKITYIYLFSLCLSPILHILDMGTDTYLAYQYYYHNEYGYFLLTVIFVVIPALISTLFSVRMYVRDYESVSYMKWTFRCLLLALQISPVIRYLEALYHAIALKRNEDNAQEYKKHSVLLLKEDSNLALLRILECFLEAAPQQVLQISILLIPGRPEMPTILQIYLYLSLITSFLSTSWTLAMYHRSIRFAQKDKANMKWIATIVQFFWLFFFMSSRILTIGQAASVYPRGTLMCSIIHWCVMTAWLSMFEKTWFCSSPSDTDSKIVKLNEFLFCAVMGLVYIFSYVAVTDQPTRYRYSFYYSVCFIENVSSIIVWVANPSSSVLIFILPITTFGMFVFGIVMMLVYYSHYHPSMCYETEVRSLRNLGLSPTMEKNISFNNATRSE